MTDIYLEILKKIAETGTFSANAADADLDLIEKAIDGLDRLGCFRIVNKTANRQTGGRNLDHIMVSGLTDTGRSTLAELADDERG